MTALRTPLALLLVLACGVAHPSVVAQETSKGAGTSRSYKARGDVDPTMVRLVVGNLGVAGRFAVFAPLPSSTSPTATSWK